MGRLTSFMTISLDGYYADAQGDMSWAHARDDAEWHEFVNGNVKGDGALVFGRVTYEMMASFWPTPMAQKQMPVVAERMSARPKYVFSRKLKQANWSNTTVLSGDLVSEVRRLKSTSPHDLTILGSASLVMQLADAGLLDGIQVAVAPLALGGGRSLFGGLGKHLPLRLTKSRQFRNGNVVLDYERA